MAIKRGDAEDFGAVGGAGPLFDEADAFADSKVLPEPLELVVGNLIWRRHRGRMNAVPLAKLMAITGEDERSVRGIVEQLVVTHRMRIGAWEKGYYIIQDADDLQVAIARPKAQIFAMWRRLRVLLEPHALKELHGQLGLDGKA